jgi:cell division protein FtsX
VTNKYIRIPFIVEGATIGMVGALLASLFASLLYNELVKKFSPDSLGSMTLGASRYTLLPTGHITLILFLLNLFVGITLCTVISAVSVRKYAKV